MNLLPYLSCSSMCTFEMDKQKFLDIYVYGNKQRISKNMAYGSKLADSMENEVASGDLLLDLMMAKLPKYDLPDMIIEDKEKGVEITNPHDGQKYVVPFIQDRKEIIPLVAKPDSAKSDYSAFLEYKTSTKKWTQKLVDESTQLTFYATAIYLKTGKIPEDIELVNVQTEYQEDGSMTVTGEIYRFKTHRTLVDILRMQSRIKKAWSGIKTLTANELL